MRSFSILLSCSAAFKMLGASRAANIAKLNQLSTNEKSTPIQEIGDLAKTLKTLGSSKDTKKIEALTASLKEKLMKESRRLIKEDHDDNNSILLGALFSRSHADLSQNLEVIRAPQFQHLPVAEYLKSLKDTDVNVLLKKNQLAFSVASWLDKHPDLFAMNPDVKENQEQSKKPEETKTTPISSATLAAVASKNIRGSPEAKNDASKPAANSTDTHAAEKMGENTDESQKSPKSQKSQKSPKSEIKEQLHLIIEKMEKAVKSSEEHQSKREDAYKQILVKREDIFKKNKKLKNMFDAQHKQQMRKYEKQVASMKKNIATLKEAETAVESGNMDALMKAKSTLESSLQTLKARQGDFLHLFFLQVSDCPYCKAQCIEKCHDDGKTFSSCLAQCADAF